MNVKISLMLRNAIGGGTENDKRREVEAGPVNMLLFLLTRRERKIDCKVIFAKMVLSRSGLVQLFSQYSHQFPDMIGSEQSLLYISCSLRFCDKKCGIS